LALDEDEWLNSRAGHSTGKKYFINRVLYIMDILYVIAHCMRRYCNFLWQVHWAFTLGSVIYILTTNMIFVPKHVAITFVWICSRTRSWNNFLCV